MQKWAFFIRLYLSNFDFSAILVLLGVNAHFFMWKVYLPELCSCGGDIWGGLALLGVFMGPPQTGRGSKSGFVGPRNEQIEQKRPQEGENP